MESDFSPAAVSGPPMRPVNRPGQPALACRIGTHGTFAQRMLARLRTQPVADASGRAARPLAALTTRDPDDPAVALVDAWAVAADVITFYQERIANEGFLRTATERRSVLELARAVGYELSAGVAASAFLAFTVEDAPGGPESVVVPKGTRVQSIPGQDELPQTFETMEAFEARRAWNALRAYVPPAPDPPPPAARAQTLDAASTELWLQGTDTRLKPGDPLLLGFPQTAGGDLWRLASLQTVAPDSVRNATRVGWGGGALKDLPGVTIAGKPVLPPAPGVFALRQQAGMFGNVAPDWKKLPLQQRKDIEGIEVPGKEWPGFGVEGNAIDLDATLPGLVAGTLAILLSADSTKASLFTIARPVTLGRADFMLSAKVTRLELDATLAAGTVNRRTASVLLQSEPLAILPALPAPAGAPAPAAPPTTGPFATALVLDSSVSGLMPGQFLAVSGKTVGGASASEVVTLTGVAVDDRRTRLVFRPPLQADYLLATVTVAANVVRATHGETVAGEVLGSGDGRLANQRFTMRRTPLTRLSVPTAEGADEALEVRVNGLLWQRVPSLFGLGPRSTAYTLRRDDDGRSSVIFGDGASGARLPSGQENVTATYRFGMGAEGNVAAGTLTLLQTRPLGIRSVANPLPAQGGAPPETLESARDRTPRTVVTLGRIVSQRDFEELAQSFTGIGKAQSALLWTGEARILHLTVADVAGAPVARGSDLQLALAATLRSLGNGLQSFQIDPFTPRSFAVAAKLWIDAGFRPEDVAAAVGQALRKVFSFPRRAFGQGVAAAEILAVMHGVAGVVAVDLDRLAAEDDPRDGAPPAFLAAALARVEFAAGEAHIQPAELLLIRPDGIALQLLPLAEPRP